MSVQATPAVKVASAAVGATAQKRSASDLCANLCSAVTSIFKKTKTEAAEAAPAAPAEVEAPVTQGAAKKDATAPAAEKAAVSAEVKKPKEKAPRYDMRARKNQPEMTLNSQTQRTLRHQQQAAKK